MTNTYGVTTILELVLVHWMHAEGDKQYMDGRAGKTAVATLEVKGKTLSMTVAWNHG